MPDKIILHIPYLAASDQALPPTPSTRRSQADLDADTRRSKGVNRVSNIKELEAQWKSLQYSEPSPFKGGGKWKQRRVPVDGDKRGAIEVSASPPTVCFGQNAQFLTDVWGGVGTAYNLARLTLARQGKTSELQSLAPLTSCRIKFLSLTYLFEFETEREAMEFLNLIKLAIQHQYGHAYLAIASTNLTVYLNEPDLVLRAYIKSVTREGLRTGQRTFATHTVRIELDLSEAFLAGAKGPLAELWRPERWMPKSGPTEILEKLFNELVRKRLLKEQKSMRSNFPSKARWGMLDERDIEALDWFVAGNRIEDLPRLVCLPPSRAKLATDKIKARVSEALGVNVSIPKAAQQALTGKNKMFARTLKFSRCVQSIETFYRSSVFSPATTPSVIKRLEGFVANEEAKRMVG